MLIFFYNHKKACHEGYFSARTFPIRKLHIMFQNTTLRSHWYIQAACLLEVIVCVLGTKASECARGIRYILSTYHRLGQLSVQRDHL